MYLENVTSEIFGEQYFEKGLGGTKAPQKRTTKIQNRMFVGHTGTGMRPTRNVRLSSVPTAITPSTTSVSQSSSAPIAYSVPESKEDWMNHKDMLVGSIVKIQHPHKHERPIFAQIVSIGNDGISAIDSHSNIHKIRWPHILEVHGVISGDHDTLDTREAMIDLSHEGMPLSEEYGIDDHELTEATKHLREIGIPLETDFVNFDKNDNIASIYDELMHLGIPIDPADFIEIKSSEKEVPEHLHGIIKHIQSLGATIDPKELAKLPYSEMLKVLDYYLEKHNGKNKK